MGVGCKRESEQAPAPDVALESQKIEAVPVPREPEFQLPPNAAAGAVTLANSVAPGAAERAARRPDRTPDFKYLAQIRNAGDAGKGKLARMYLKFSKHYEFQPRWVVMVATDGSYASAMLHYEEGFEQMVKDMQPGFLYEVEFEVTGVSTGGQPRGEIVTIDQRSAGPVADQTQFLPAIEAVQKARELPPEAKEVRRAKMYRDLKKVVDQVDAEAGYAIPVDENTPPAAAPQQ